MRAEVIGGNPSSEQVAAIVAALSVIEAERAEAAAAAPPTAPELEQVSMWVEASRRSAQRSGMQRGPWRLSGRLGKRARV